MNLRIPNWNTIIAVQLLFQSNVFVGGLAGAIDAPRHSVVQITFFLPVHSSYSIRVSPFYRYVCNGKRLCGIIDVRA